MIQVFCFILCIYLKLALQWAMFCISNFLTIVLSCLIRVSEKGDTEAIKQFSIHFWTSINIAKAILLFRLVSVHISKWCNE